MEFYSKEDHSLPNLNLNEESEIQKIYSGCHIFITGATGFMGKILLEKILRTCKVAKVYLLVRAKKGKTQTERLQDLLGNVVFEKTLSENRNARNLITLMNGDCTLPDLGLSEDDRRVLCTQVDFIFHVAATVNMTEDLRTAFIINVIATRYLLELAKTMKKLKVFLYVSTVYAQVMLDKIEEKFYPTDYSPEELEQIIQDLDDSQLSAITPLIVGKLTNSYSLTKAVTEYMLSKYHPEVPVAVVRPSIVMSTIYEPLVGWSDTKIGANGVYTGLYLGLLRVWRIDPNAVFDMIPVDIAINMMLAVGWHVATHRPKPENKIIFNLVSSVKKPITWKEYTDFNEKVFLNEELPSMKACGCYNFTFVKNETLFWIYTILFHFIPGLFCDCLRILARLPPKFLSAYRMVYKLNQTFFPYSGKEFKFVDDNIDEVWASMKAKDRKMFNFDVNTFTYEQYFRNYVRGIRVYLLKDPMDTLNQSRKRYQKIYYITHLIRGLLILSGGWLVMLVVSTFL